MERRTYRLPAETIREIAAEAARRGITEAVYVRAALDRQLGRDSCLDEIGKVERRSLERDAAIEERVDRVTQRVIQLGRRVSR